VVRRGRSAASLPKFTLEAGKKSVDVHFPAGWLEAHPLTRADLEQEANYLEAAGFELRYR
ncbi:MAG: exopolyphosphatase, partial [Pseudomonadota bacterium]